MKIKTSIRISIIFSIFTFFIILLILVFLNIFSFFGWYNQERDEVSGKLNHRYEKVLKKYNKISKQKEKLVEKIEELGGFIIIGENLKNYNKIFLELYNKEELFFIIHKKETEFGNIFLPYDVTSYIHTQIRLMKIGLILLIIFTLLSFVISRFLFIKLALKDIFFISQKLRNIDLNNIKKINIDLNKNDEINTIVNSLNNFLAVIEQNTRSLKEFNIQVSHEFKTPLMVISSELEYLSLSGKNNESYKKIEKQIDLLNELLETFLFISKIENLKGDIKKSDVNIGNIIFKQIENLGKIYSDKNIKIVNKGTKQINLKTNRKLLEILIKNILDNAFKYNKQGGEITINLENNYLTIKDNGIGINKKYLSKIFENFYRVDSVKKGYGVGLNIVQKVVNILGYKVEVKSEEGKGSNFKILFK